jgi:hypothetical protein
MNGTNVTCDISVVIPLYNKRAEIARCLRSVQAQTMKNLEAIVIDDGSLDDGASIVETFCRADERFRLYKQTNEGLAGARNKGVAMACAGRIAFLDADDEWLPEHLAHLKALSDRIPNAGLYFTAYWIDRGGGWRRRVRVPRRFRERGGCIIHTGFFGIPDGGILPSGTMVRKEAIDSAGGFKKMFGEDIDLLLRMAASHRFAYSHAVTAVWHVDAGNRMCVQQIETARPYTPGGIGGSLAQVLSNQSISAQTKKRATDYVARRELKAILSTLSAGQRSHARSLYQWWQEHFHRRSEVVAGLLRCPIGVLRFVGKVREQLRRARIIMAYLLELPANFATFQGK